MISGNLQFGSYLRTLRESRRLSLEDVERLTARECEPVTRSLLSRLENGRSRISAVKLVSLAQLYRIRFGLLAERLELALASEVVDCDGTDRKGIGELLDEAREAARRGQLARARLLYERASGAAAAAGDSAQLEAQLGLAHALLKDGRPASARASIEELLRRPLTPTQSATALCLLAQAALDGGLLLLARAAVLSLREHPRPWPPAVEAAMPALDTRYWCEQGQWELAFEAGLRALDRATAAGDRVEICARRLDLARVERGRGQLEGALRWCELACHEAEALAPSALGAAIWTELGRIQRDRKRFDLAQQAWVEAKRLARRADHHLSLFEVTLECWRVAHAQGNAVDERATLRTLRHLVRFLDELPAHARDLTPHLEALTIEVSRRRVMPTIPQGQTPEEASISASRRPRCPPPLES